MRVLVIDDDYNSRRQVKALLSGRSDCDGAPNGHIGLELFRVAQAEPEGYGLIVLDINMPDMSGREVLEEIRRSEENAPEPRKQQVQVLMLSVFCDANHILGSFRAGCEGYLVKPLTATKLREALTKLGLVGK